MNQEQADDFLGRLTGSKNRAAEVAKKAGGNRGQKLADSLCRRLATGKGPKQKNVQESRRRQLTDTKARKTPRGVTKAKPIIDEDED